MAATRSAAPEAPASAGQPQDQSQDDRPASASRIGPLIASAFDATASVRLAVWALLLLAIAVVLYLAASLLLPIIVAATLALLLSPAVGALRRVGLPQPAAAGLVMLAVLLLVGGVAINVVGPAQRWIETAPKQLARLEDRVSALMQPVAAVREATEQVSELAADNSKPKPREVVVERTGLGSVLNVTVNSVITVLSTLLLAYFLLACGEALLRKIVTVTPEREDKLRMLGIAHTIQREVGRYFATITLINTGLGIATGIGMWALGMPTPILWGVAVALLNFLPYIGPLIATVMLAAVGLLTFDSVWGMLAPPALFLALNFIEDHLVLPFLLGRSLRLNPVVIFMWVLVWAWMWGIGGVLIAVPLLVALRICAERLPRLQPLAVVLSR